MTTRVLLRLSQKQVQNQFFFFLFSPSFSASEKEPTKKNEMILMMILALLLLFAPPFSNEFGGLVGVHGFYLPGVAPQGTIFLSLFVLFVLLRVCS
jgi:hypothetical protein